MALLAAGLLCAASRGRCHDERRCDTRVRAAGLLRETRSSALRAILNLFITEV